jgi:hypothetical protein
MFDLQQVEPSRPKESRKQKHSGRSKRFVPLKPETSDESSSGEEDPVEIHRKQRELLAQRKQALAQSQVRPIVSQSDSASESTSSEKESESESDSKPDNESATAVYNSLDDDPWGV